MPTDRFSNVLVVEDNPSDLQLLCDTLQEEGFQVIGCGSAGEALEHVQQRDFGVAVVDYRLPDLSGTQLLERIRSFDDQIRVIIYTGDASYDSIKEAINLGAFAYRREAERSAASCCGTFIGRAWSGSIVMRWTWSRPWPCAPKNSPAATASWRIRLGRRPRFAVSVADDLRLLPVASRGIWRAVRATGHEYLDQIVGGAARMDRLIEDLLEYSRAGRSRQPFEQVDMESVLVQARANLEASIREQEARDRGRADAHGDRRSDPIGAASSEPAWQRDQVSPRASRRGFA